MKLLILFTNLVCIYCYYGTMRNNPTIVVEEQQALDLPSNTKTDYVRACYFTNWSQYRQGRGKYVPEDYIPGLCTHILFAFGWMNEDFTVRAFDPADLPNDWAGEGLYRRLNNMKRVDTNLKTLLSIGGWSFGTRLFKDMAKSAASRKVFIDSSIQFVRKWNFDGIDIDWEYPAGPEDFKDFALLVKEIKEAAVAEAKTSGKNVLLITAAVSASKVTIDNGYDVPEISLYFDYIFLMNYDFHGAWSTDIGFNSPLYSRQGMKPGEEVWNIDFAAKYWNQKGMPKEKIIVGVATYGRGWTMKDPNNANPGAQGSPARVTPYTQEAGVASYYELCDMLSKGAKRYWHDEQKVPYLIDGDQFWGYDDKESVQIKMDYIKDQQFGGAFVWTLDFDDFNGQCPLSDGEQYPLIGVIAKELAGITIPRKTVPTIAPTAVPTIPTVPVTTQRPSTPMPTVGPIITTTTAAEKNICKGRPEGFSGDLTDCQQFVLCLLDKSYKMRCPLGLHFSPSRKYCVLKSDSDCVDASPPSTKAPTPTTTTTQSTIITTQAGSTVSTGGFVCSGDGFYGDPSNCAKFFRCVNGLKYSFECASGLSFHNDSLMCDHPDPSKCAQPL